MVRLALTFLGSFQAATDGAPIARFQTDKVRALLAYLAVEAERPHMRASLCGLLWPDQNDDAALHNLSQTLLRLREALGDTRGASSFLRVSRQSIQWNPASDHQLDAADFARLAASTDANDLEQAVALYQGEFLPGLSLPGCDAFEEWLLLTRERLAHLALTALDALTQARLAAGHYDQAEQHARRQLALDPWREEAHAQVMRALAYSGQRAAALAQYDACRRILDAELGVEPSPELAALYAQIKAGLLRPSPPPAVARGPWPPPAPPTPLLGRDEELAFITARLRDPGCRIVTLTGPGGVGKTHLSLQAAQLLGEAFDDGVVFISLAAIPDSELVLPTIARTLDVPQVPGHSLFNSVSPSSATNICCCCWTTSSRWLLPRRA